MAQGNRLTKAEFREFIEVHTAAPKPSRQTLEMIRLFDFIKDHGQEDWTVGKCWKAAQATPKAANER